MIPSKLLPYPDDFSSEEAFVQSLLTFVTATDMWQVLCGGVHILDFFTNEPSLFESIMPEDWRHFLLGCEPMDLLDLLLREDLAAVPGDDKWNDNRPPASFIEYAKGVRRHSLARNFTSRSNKKPAMSHQVAVGMKSKKKHEVANFASYVDALANDVSRLRSESAPGLGQESGITHLVDFGSGQNYLGRTLAREPYHRSIVAVEGREHNIEAAKQLDVKSGIAGKERVMRNKKIYHKILDEAIASVSTDKAAPASRPRRQDVQLPDSVEAGEMVYDLRPGRELGTHYEPLGGKGSIDYIQGNLEDGDLSEVIRKLRDKLEKPDQGEESSRLSLMGVSIHSCGNLSHYGIRSLAINPEIHAVAIVGCCYNLLTERLGPPTYKHPYLRPSVQALNGRVVRESERRDPQGFPMSDQLGTYDGGRGIRLNITARMMACQAPQNWTAAESHDFFTRHFYRAVLQKMFLDRGVVTKVHHGDPSTPAAPPDRSGSGDDDVTSTTPYNSSTNPVIIGSLRKGCYSSLGAYVRGAVAKITAAEEQSAAAADGTRRSSSVAEKMADMTDEEIARYEGEYAPRMREVSAVWTLMAFSACVAESLIVCDRWLFLREQSDVRHAWVEAVFDYAVSPRNLVVVGIKE